MYNACVFGFVHVVNDLTLLTMCFPGNKQTQCDTVTLQPGSSVYTNGVVGALSLGAIALGILSLALGVFALKKVRC